MSRARPDELLQTAAAFNTRGSGCLTGYILPPLAVLIIGSLLAIFAFTVTPENITVRAAGAPVTNQLLDSAVGAFLPDPAKPERAVGAGPNQPFVDKIAGPPVAPARAAIQMTFPNQPVQAAPAGSGGLSPIFTPEIQYWKIPIVRWSKAAGVDPNLTAVVMQIESCGDPSATSGSGAIGLFQVMPDHFDWTDSPYDPDTNAARGLDYLRRSLSTAGNDARLAFAGYNGGIGVIGRSEWSWPAETVRYAYWGSGIYEDAISGRADSPHLQEWLNAGGSGLCSQAGSKLGISQ